MAYYPETDEKPAVDKFISREIMSTACNSLIDKVKRSFYNTLCWQAVDSEEDIRRPRLCLPREFNTNKEAIYNVVKKYGDNVVKKCGNYLESRSQRKWPKIANSEIENARAMPEPSETQRRKRSAYSRVASSDPCSEHESEEIQDSYEKYRKRDTSESKGNRYSQLCRNDKEQDAPMRIIPQSEDCKVRGYFHLSKDKKEDAPRDRRKIKMNDNDCLGEVDRKSRRYKQSQEGNDMVKTVWCDGKLKKICNLTPEQCRVFKNCGVVKVNVRVEPNVSVRDFDIIIRKDRVSKSAGSECESEMRQ